MIEPNNDTFTAVETDEQIEDARFIAARLKALAENLSSERDRVLLEAFRDCQIQAGAEIAKENKE